jgi:hypothetical protein
MRFKKSNRFKGLKLIGGNRLNLFSKKIIIHVPLEQRVGRKKRNKLFMFHRNNVWVEKLEFFVPSLKLLNKCFFDSYQSFNPQIVPTERENYFNSRI